MAVQFSQDTRPIAVTTPLGKDVLLLESFTGVEAISELFHFDLSLLTLLKTDSDTGIAFDALLGQSISVVLKPKGLTERNFNGIVSKVSEGHRIIGATGSRFLRYHVEMVPATWLLTRGKKSLIFQQKSVPDILKLVLGSDGVRYSGITDTYEPREYCIQYQESDFAFASRLMEEEGIFYYFEHTATSHTLVLVDEAESIAKIAGPDSISFDEFVRGERDEERITSWVKSQEVRAGKQTLWDYCFEDPTKNYENQRTLKAAESVAVGTKNHKLKVGGNDTLEIYSYPGEFAKRFDGVSSSGGDQAANVGKIYGDGSRTGAIRMEQEAVAGFIIDAASDCRLLTSGYKFTFAGHFNANGDYVLLKVTHEASVEGTYTSDEQTSNLYTNTFQCIPAALSFRPARRTPRPTIDGTQTAVVVGPAGEEIFTDKYSRVKVQFPWDREGKKDAGSSCWVRVGSPWAGQQWGMIHIPRIGQEVIVAFEEGDPDRPIIVGSVYNATNMPPYTLPDNKTQSGILTRSSLKGDSTTFNQLRFEDKKGSEEVYFHAEKDFNRVVQNNDALQVGYETKDGDHKSDDGSQTIKIYKNRTETLETGDESITIAKGSQTIKIHKDRTETLETGDESVTISQGKRTHSVKSDESLTVEGKQTIEITGDRTITVKQGNESITISQGNRSLTVSVGNDTTKVSAGASSTEAMKSITLKVGGNSIVIDQTGVTIKGIAVTIQGQATLDAKSPMTTVNGDGTLTLKGGVVMIN